jgi:hypothetical protein
MTEPADYSTEVNPEVQLTVEQLRSQCYELIDTISRRPGAKRYLLNLLPLLRLYSKYKQRRVH